jgi:hypothetical protein
MTELSEMKQKLTPRGRQILDQTVQRKGQKWVEENSDLILSQAELVGMTKDPEE